MLGWNTQNVLKFTGYSRSISKLFTFVESRVAEEFARYEQTYRLIVCVNVARRSFSWKSKLVAICVIAVVVDVASLFCKLHACDKLLLSRGSFNI